MYNKTKKIAEYFLIFTLIVCSFVWGAFTVKDKIFPYNFVKSFYTKITGTKKSVDSYKLDNLWAKKITKGGYILHFRHAQREKWHDVTAFDAYEVYTKSNAETSSYARATCLTPQGIEEAKLIDKVFNINGVKWDKVISSPSCRAVQTAQHAFGKVDFLDTSLLHRTAMMFDQHEYFAKKLRELLVAASPPGQNTILSGHGSTLENDKKILFEDEQTVSLERKETGFVVIENVNGKLYIRHTFASIKNYVNASLELPIN